MLAVAKRAVQRTLSVANLRLVRTTTAGARPMPFPVELGPDDRAIFDHVRANRLTMVSNERLFSTLMACHHVVDQHIPGDFVECGVWRGGNSILAADVFRRRSPDRSVYLFDTFAGMTKPSGHDSDYTGADANPRYRKSVQQDNTSDWCNASLDEVRSNFSKAGLLTDKVRFIQGDVSVTLEHSSNLPSTIAVLRLDTDWYESSRKELEVLYPRLSRGGVLIIDDYGHWKGARLAVDEYFQGRRKPLLHYVDYAAREGTKA